jgi:predicted metal-binding transcription factor (methanogenesis marker protein 9)
VRPAGRKYMQNPKIRHVDVRKKLSRKADGNQGQGSYESVVFCCRMRKACRAERENENANVWEKGREEGKEML